MEAPVFEKGYPNYEAVNGGDYLMSKQEVTVTVTLDEFRTVDLLQAMIIRLDDNLNDPEPKHDPYLNSLSTDTKRKMLSCFREYF